MKRWLLRAALMLFTIMALWAFYIACGDLIHAAARDYSP